MLICSQEFKAQAEITHPLTRNLRNQDLRMINFISRSGHALLFTALYIISGCHAPVNEREESLAKNAEFLHEQGQINWEKRDKPEHARMARYFLSKAYSLNPENNDLALQYCRAIYFEGVYLETEQGKKDSLFLEAAQVARSILFRTTEFADTYRSTEGDSTVKEITALTEASQELVPPMFWWAASLGRYLVNQPVMVRLNYREVLEATMHRILALEPNYYYGGPYRFFGTFYARLPGVDLNYAKNYFEKALASNPNFLGTQVLRAKYYHTKAGNRDLFHADLEAVLQSDPTLIPDVMPENTFEQERARLLLDQESLLFE